MALNVRDIQKFVDFYSKILGMQLEWMPDEDNAYVTTAQDNLALSRLPNPPKPTAMVPGHFIIMIRTGC